jgi:hypothetical protein
MSWQYKLASSVRASPRVIVTRPNARLLLRPTAGGAAGGFSAGSGTWDNLRYLRLYIDGALIFPPSTPLQARFPLLYRMTTSHCFFPSSNCFTGIVPSLL